jgi:hypothetical protein
MLRKLRRTDMLANCVGFDDKGYRKEVGLDSFDDYEVTERVHIVDIDVKGNILQYSSSKADDEYFNICVFKRYDGSATVVQTAGTVYIMDNSGKTFRIIHGSK